MKSLFASKEIPFLKSDSDIELAGPPKEYLSDLVDLPSKETTAFSLRLESAKIPETGFVCAIIRVARCLNESDKDKIAQCFESTFQCVFQSNSGKPVKKQNDGSAGKKYNGEQSSPARRGIWESLGQDTFALAFWDYEKESQAKKILESLKKNLGNALGRGILMGRAWYPCKDFLVVQTFHNALKALDHAAFFHDNHLQDFDEVSLNISGDRSYQAGNYESAIKEYQKGLVMNAHNINLINSLGVCFGVKKDLEKAREYFQKALDILPEEIMVLYNMGLVLHIQNQDERAIAYLKKAREINSEIYEIELLLGKLFQKINQDDKALIHLEQASLLKPESSVPLRLKGDIFLAQEKFSKAAQAFNQAVKLNSQDAAALSGYAIAMANQGKNLQIALTFARNSIAMEPDNPIFSKRLSRILHLQEHQTQSKLA